MLKLKKYQEAIQCFDKYIELEPNYSNVYENKGAALYEEAIKCCNKTIKLNQISQNHFKGFSHYSETLQLSWNIEPNRIELNRTESNSIQFNRISSN